jgi:prevent-host-death family protein
VDWNLQDAKNQFSKVVRLARSEGPQTVSLRGERAAVVVSAEEFDRLTGKTESFVEHLLAGPAWDDEVVDEIDRRAKAPSRPVVDL